MTPSLERWTFEFHTSQGTNSRELTGLVFPSLQPFNVSIPAVDEHIPGPTRGPTPPSYHPPLNTTRLGTIIRSLTSFNMTIHHTQSTRYLRTIVATAPRQSRNI